MESVSNQSNISTLVGPEITIDKILERDNLYKQLKNSVKNGLIKYFQGSINLKYISLYLAVDDVMHYLIDKIGLTLNEFLEKLDLYDVELSFIMIKDNFNSNEINIDLVNLLSGEIDGDTWKQDNLVENLLFDYVEIIFRQAGYKEEEIIFRQAGYKKKEIDYLFEDYNFLNGLSEIESPKEVEEIEKENPDKINKKLFQVYIDPQAEGIYDAENSIFEKKNNLRAYFKRDDYFYQKFPISIYLLEDQEVKIVFSSIEDVINLKSFTFLKNELPKNLFISDVVEISKEDYDNFNLSKTPDVYIY